jgi:peptide subunit release factor 1 (eRF1)
MSYRTKQEVLNLLERLEGLPARWLTLYVTPNEWPTLLDGLEIAGYEDYVEEMEIARRIKTTTGIAIFWNAEHGRYAIVPPLPIQVTEVLEGFHPSPLKELLSMELVLGIVLLRRGPYALGVFDGDKLVSSKCGKRYVLPMHRKGGMSAARFSRVRRAQVQRLYKEVAKQVELKFRPYERRIDWIFLGGDRIACKQLVKLCPFLQRLEDRISARILDVRKPSRESLEKILGEVWKSRVYEF